MIDDLNIGDECVEDVGRVKKETFEFFKGHFSKNSGVVLSISNLI